MLIKAARIGAFAGGGKSVRAALPNVLARSIGPRRVLTQSASQNFTKLRHDLALVSIDGPI
jgi:hypothetical protein